MDRCSNLAGKLLGIEQHRMCRVKHTPTIWLLFAIWSSLCIADEQNHEHFHDINIPSLNAAEGLNRLAEQTGTIMLFPFDIAEARQANSVVGHYKIQDALAILLRDSGLSGSLSDSRVVQITLDEVIERNKGEGIVTSKNRSFGKRIGAVIASVFIASGAAAQDASSSDDGAREMEEIYVTGSRIKRLDLSSVGPTTVLTESDIDNTGLSNVEVLLQRLPASAGFAGNSNAAYWVGGGWGTTQVNLRGLGINRTLVLLNGRRVVYGGSGANASVDLNMIPTSILSRVEVLKDGASAVYGADAIAGVVNFITKDSYDGLRLDAKYGETSFGDGEETRLNLTWGVTGDKGSMIFDANYQLSRKAPLDARAPCSLADISGTNTLECTPGSSSTAGGRAALPDGSQINFISGGGFEPFDIQRHGFNSNPFFNASNPVERFTVSTFGNFELSDSTRTFVEVLYNWRNSTQPGSPATLRNLSFDAAHPTNPTGEDIIVLARRTTEYGARIFEQEVNTWRVVAGVEGDLSDKWSYDVSFNWGRNNAVDALLNNINTQRFAQTLDAAVCGSGGIPCANLLGEGSLSAEAGEYFLFNQRDTGGNEQKSITANVTGSIFDMPAGAVGFAAGIEIREDSGWLDPDSLLSAGAALGNAQDPIEGKIEATEIYSEVHIPLITGAPFAEALNLDLAVRYSDYDLFGDSTNYKAGLNWQVLPSLKFRGTYSTAFRAPSVPEIFSGVREGQIPTVDPCSDWSSQAPTSAIYMNCQAAGVPDGYMQFGNIIVTDQGGNPNLLPEDANTFTVGVVIEPEIVPGLALTIDYFDIDIDNAISQTDGSRKLDICYTSTGLSHAFCGAGHHTRNSITGEVDFLSTQSANTGNEVMKGFDIGATYGFDIGAVQNTVSLNTSHLQKYEIVGFEGDDARVRDGGVGCCIGGYPKFRANASWVADTDRWSGSYNLQVIGEATDWNGAPGQIGTDIDAVLYHSIQASYKLSDDIVLRLGVDNLLDEDAPYVRSWSDGNTDTLTYSLLGRVIYARATFQIM